MQARDIEEISPNKFVAYVDDEKESYDVTIEFDKKNILDISCDCPKHTTFCVHKITLINFFKTKKPAKGIVSVKRKKTESEVILEQLDESTLRLWASELFKKNKDIEFLFVNEFSKSEIQYTKKEVSAVVDKAIRSVIKNKKKIDATELKRIIDTLDLALAPVSEYCKENIVLPETNELFLFSNSILFEFHNNMNLNSIKLIRFIEKRYKEINLYIHSIQNRKHWETIVDENIKFLLLENSMYGMQMETVFDLYESIDTKERRAFFSGVLFEIHTITVNKGTRYIKEITQFFLKVFSENDMFRKVYKNFKPIRYDNEYNVFLIEKLIEIEMLDLAETIAIQQIEGNYQERYNVGYYQLLSKIYTISADEKKMALLQMKLIFYNFSLDSYKLIQKHAEVDVFKKFRIKLLTAFKRDFYGSDKAVQAYFEILYFEKKFKNMIDNISEHTSYELIFNYKEDLFLFDKLSFLLSLLKIEWKSFYYKEDKLIAEHREKFVDWIKEKYDNITIQTVVDSRKKYGISKLIKSLEV
ncbi:hypothetical protein [Flavobacterium sp. 1]|uniref:hypothetical protein n=1 Tax=Flavobacterium sp. 1 TaxID=2035200 RepID=UPI0012FE0921|nr:hypothetical protein [Flavobacterium sp. 1]